MNVTIDGKSCDLGLHPEVTFPEIMSVIGRLDPSPGIGITRVLLDGADITGADWSHLSAVPAATIQALEVETGSVSKLANELIDSLEDFAGRLVTELGSTAESFRQGEQEKAIGQYTRALDGIQLLNHTTDMVIRNLDFDAEQVTFGGKPSTNHFQKLSPLLDDMFSAQKRDDVVLLADLIEYELIPQFEDHQKILKLWREAYATRR